MATGSLGERISSAAAGGERRLFLAWRPLRKASRRLLKYIWLGGTVS